MKPPIALLAVLLIVLAAGLLAWLWLGSDDVGIRPDAPAGQSTTAGAAAGDAAQSSQGNAAPAAAVERQAAPSPSGTASDGAAEDPGAADDEPEPAGPWLRGRVVDARGEGLAKARVVLADERAEQLPFRIGGLDDMMAGAGNGVRTADDGTFAIRMQRREGGDYRLIATHARHPRGGTNGNATADKGGIVITLRDGVSITGRVLGGPPDAANVRVFCKRIEGGIGNAMAGAVIDLGGLVDALGIPIGARNSALDEEARFELHGLDPASSYRVWAAQMQGDSDPGAWASGGDIPDDVELGQWRKTTIVAEFAAGTQGVELMWREPTIVTVRVIDARTNAPIEHLTVSAGTVRELSVLGLSVPVPALRPIPQEEFPGGIVEVSEFEVTSAESTTLALEIRAEGKKRWIRRDIDGNRTGVIDLGTASLAEAPIVVTEVIDAATGQPIAGAEVELESFEPPGDDDGEASERSGSVSFSARTNVATPAGPNIDLDDPGGQKKTVTDENGHCRITPVFEGQAHVIVRAEDYALASSEPFSLQPAGEQPITVRLRRGGAVTVRTRDGHGNTLANAVVERQGPVAGDKDTARTNAAGERAFTGLTPGEHQFRLLGTDAGDEGGLRIQLQGLMETGTGETVLVQEGGSAELVLTEPLRGRLTGTVTMNGRPLDRAQIQLLPAGLDDEESAAREMASQMIEATVGQFLGGTSQTDESDVDGWFEIQAIDIGEYRLVVRHDDLAMPATQPVTVVEGDNQVNVPLQLTIVKGRVVDDRGEPIARASIAALPASPETLDVATQMGDARGMLTSLFGGGGSEPIRTDGDGNFELRGVRPGMALAIQAEARLHVTGNTTIEPIPAGTTRDGVEIVLRGGGRVSVSAVGVRGALAARATWAGPAPADGKDPRARDAMLRRSRTTIDGLLPGRWRVELKGLGASEDAQPQFVEIQRGKTARATFGR